MCCRPPSLACALCTYAGPLSFKLCSSEQNIRYRRVYSHWFRSWFVIHNLSLQRIGFQPCYRFICSCKCSSAFSREHWVSRGTSPTLCTPHTRQLRSCYLLFVLPRKHTTWPTLGYISLRLNLEVIRRQLPACSIPADRRGTRRRNQARISTMAALLNFMNGNFAPA